MLDSAALLPRRKILEGGLAGFAAAMMARVLPGCDGGGGTDAGPGATDAGFDAGLDAGPPAPVVFEPRDVPARPSLVSRIAELGPLGEPDANGVRVPVGFTSRVVARSGEPVAGTSYTWHRAPDGGATYVTEDGGWIYVSNAELPLIGGVGALRFDASGAIVAAYPILERTMVNCAGGATPWHSWLSCEEIARGHVYECDPWGEREPVVRPALGVFKHEAAAVDPVNAHVYLTEDESDGRFYRFVPAERTRHGHPDLNAGTLEVASVDTDGNVRWLTVPDPTYEGTVPTAGQVADSTRFRGGEGIWYHAGVVYFATKGDNRVWAYDIASATLEIIYEHATSDTPILRGVDNVTVSCCGDVLVAEDGGSMQIVAILPSGEPRALVQVVGHDESEITGPAFSPDGTRLYFSSQRGATGAGVTFEITGPFHAPA